MYDIKMLKAKKLAELIEIAEQIGIKELAGLKKQEIMNFLGLKLCKIKEIRVYFCNMLTVDFVI